MTTIRTFIAAVLVGSSTPWIVSTQKELLKQVGSNAIKLTPLEQIHLTLVFLGEVDTRVIPQLASMMDNGGLQLPISLKITQIGQFSRNGSVSVIWAGIEKSEPLMKLQSSLEKFISQIITIEQTAFKPHLTLARIRAETDAESRAKLIKFVASDRRELPLLELITEVVLFKSDLKPNGPIYTRLHTIKVQDEIQ